MDIGAQGEKVGRLVLIDGLYTLASNLAQPVKKPLYFPSTEDINEQIRKLEHVDDLIAYNFFVGMLKWLELETTQVKISLAGLEASFRALTCFTMGSLIYESFLMDASEQNLDPKNFERMATFSLFQITTFDENSQSYKDFENSVTELTVFYKRVINYNELIKMLKELTGIKEFNKIILSTQKIGAIEGYNHIRSSFDEIIYTEPNKEKRERLETLITKKLLPELPTKRKISNKKNIDILKKRILEDPQIFRKPLEIQEILKG